MATATKSGTAAKTTAKKAAAKTTAAKKETAKTAKAPVKKAILAAGLGGNVVSYTSGDLLQPHTLIILQNAKPEVAREFRRVIEDECLRLVKEGIPRERLAAILDEFGLRQTLGARFGVSEAG